MDVFTLPDGRQIGHGIGFVSNDEQFPANWLELASSDDLAAKSIGKKTVNDPVEPLPSVKARLLRAVDDDAETVRLRYITPGAGMAMTYSEKFAQAQGVNAIGKDAANGLSQQEREAQFPTLSASIGLEAETLWDCAQLVLRKYAQFAALSLAIERTRLAGKKAISEASSAEASRAAYEAIKWTV